MHCIHCGKKLPEQAKFCPDCGKTIPALPKDNLLTKKPGTAQRIISLIFAFIISAIALGVISESNIGRDARNFFTVIFAILLILVGIFFWVEMIKLIFRHGQSIFPSVKKMLALFKNHPRLIVPALIVLLALVGGGRQLIQKQQYQQAVLKLEPVQTVLAEALVIKSIGDDIQAGRPPAGWSFKKIDQEIQTVATNLQLIKPGALLGNYREQSALLMAGIKLASDGSMEWDELPDQPPIFKISLTDDQLVELFKYSLKRMGELKEFGDAAIKRGDRNSMRYIAAKISVQDHFLNSLSVANTPTLFSLNISPAYALEPLSLRGLAGRKRNPCVRKDLCLTNATKIIPGVYRSALGYAVGEADASQNWQSGWQQTMPLIEAAGYSTSGAGVSEGDKDQSPYSPAVQQFMNSCQAKGGIVGGGGGVKTRLPTTESGYTCWYDQGGKCWDLLTYSGSRFKGGAPACPEENLMPEVAEPEPTSPPPVRPTGQPPVQPTTPPRVTSWDGTYQTTSNVSCNVPGIYSSGVVPFSENITVRGNRVYDRQGSSYPISSSGQAQASVNVNYSGVSVSYRQTFNFSASGGVSGNISLSGGGSVEGQGFSINCSGSFSGSRISS